MVHFPHLQIAMINLQKASDVDQFLDDLFMPVLDTNIDDGLSDAR